MQGFTSALWQSAIIEQTVSGLRGSARDAATHARAWHGTEGAQSASFVHASSLFTGAGKLQTNGPGAAALGGLLATGELTAAPGPPPSDTPGPAVGSPLGGDVFGPGPGSAAPAQATSASASAAQIDRTFRIGGGSLGDPPLP
ncbi:hypothetical protein [Polyangium fumosum]|uniref:hypothetical protein n=1 Tax=Polyangium fumosum TaxID=889272 RepID=UPI001E36DE8E|nr:hypothetical protein [Polyangium fumosum]